MAFFQEAKPSREPFLNAPVSVFALIGVLVAAHVARMLVSSEASEHLLELYALIPARYVAAVWAAQGGSPVSIWDGAAPLVGYMFLHADYLHVGVNCLWLLVAGTPVAKRLGTGWFLALFLACGVLAGVVYVAANWAVLGAAIGASGAVAGMMGAAIRIFYGERSLNAPAAGSEGDDQDSASSGAADPASDGEAAGENASRSDLSAEPSAKAEAVGNQDSAPVHAPLAPLFGSAILFFSAIWCAANVVAGVTGLGTSGAMQAVAWEAHIGGYLAGLILIGPFDRLARRSGRRPPPTHD